MRWLLALGGAAVALVGACSSEPSPEGKISNENSDTTIASPCHGRDFPLPYGRVLRLGSQFTLTNGQQYVTQLHVTDPKTMAFEQTYNFTHLDPKSVSEVKNARFEGGSRRLHYPALDEWQNAKVSRVLRRQPVRWKDPEAFEEIARDRGVDLPTVTLAFFHRDWLGSVIIGKREAPFDDEIQQGKIALDLMLSKDCLTF